MKDVAGFGTLQLLRNVASTAQANTRLCDLFA